MRFFAKKSDFDQKTDDSQTFRSLRKKAHSTFSQIRESLSGKSRRRIGSVSSFVNPDVAQEEWREDADAEVARRGLSAPPADFNVNIDNQKRI
jgi:hypothetical protein